jgi:transcriptional regulator with PAS, ATPase and Fis domain
MAEPTENALRQQYSMLEGIINSSDAPIFSVDKQYRYTSFNRTHASVMKAIYGRDIELGQSLLDYMTVAEDREEAKRNLDRTLAGEHVVVGYLGAGVAI